MRILLASMALLCGTSLSAAAEPEKIAKDFCHAVAAQALCSKTFTMAKGTEKRMQSQAGQKLRGDGVALNGQCEAGYNEFYTMESKDGLETACRTTLSLFGPSGSRRAGLVKARGTPKMKLPEKQVEKMIHAVCYAETAAKACPSLEMSKGYDQRLSEATGVPATEKRRYFRKACGQGVFRASLNKGRKGVKLSTFCAGAHGEYGKAGTVQAGLLVATAGSASENQNANSVTQRAVKAANKALAKVVDDICTAMAHTSLAARECPGVKQATGLKDILKVQLGNVVGKIEERCKAVKAPTVTAKNRDAFCSATVKTYGPGGSDFPNMLNVATKAKEEAPAPQPQVTANPEPTGTELVILEAVPARPAGADPVKLLGGQVPGTLTGAACAPYKQAIDDAQSALASATSLKQKVAGTVALEAQGSIGQALCPNDITFKASNTVVKDVAATGLEACHIVEATGRELAKTSRDFRKQRLYRAIMALDEAIARSYAQFQPTCSSLMKARMDRMVQYARDKAKRNQDRFGCSTWEDWVRAEMKVAASFSRKRQLKKAIAALDTRVLPGIFGLEVACDANRSKYAKDRWLSTRKRYQLSMRP